jgi:predicted nucleic acid-binding protein
MSPLPPACVVDASVGIKLFVAEPLSEQAHQLFEGLAAEPPIALYVPDLFYIECTNILWKYVRRAQCPPETALADLADLAQLRLRSTMTSDLMEETLVLAIEHDITAYDACYAALARRLALPLVSADTALCKAVPWAVWLGDIDSNKMSPMQE